MGFACAAPRTPLNGCLETEAIAKRPKNSSTEGEGRDWKIKDGGQVDVK
jgi:hypothetical protein